MTEDDASELSPAQQRRVQAFVDDEWVVDDEQVVDDADALSDANLDALLAAVESPRELHAMVAEANWDGGGDNVLRVLDHPLVDPSTVLMAYWRAGPRFYAGLETLLEYQNEAFALVQELERRALLASRREARIPFDPCCDPTSCGHDWAGEYVDAHAALVSSGGTPLYSVPSALERPFRALTPATYERLRRDRSRRLTR